MNKCPKVTRKHIDKILTMMYNVFVAKQSIEIGYSNVGYIRKGSISVIQVKEMLVMARFTLPEIYTSEKTH